MCEGALEAGARACSRQLQAVDKGKPSSCMACSAGMSDHSMSSSREPRDKKTCNFDGHLADSVHDRGMTLASTTSFAVVATQETLIHGCFVVQFTRKCTHDMRG